MVNHEIGTSFDIGRVLDRTLRAITNNFVAFFLAAVLVVGVPIALIGVAQIVLVTQAVGADGTVSGDLEMNMSALITNMLIMIIGGLGGAVLQGALIYCAVADFNGERAPLRECVVIGLRHIFPLIGVTILTGLGVVLGMILLIVPGIILSLGWAVVVPVLIVEKRSVTDSISRSWNLTKGFKWWILLLFLILMVVQIIIGAIIGLIFMLPSIVELGGGYGTEALLIANALVSALTQAISSMIAAICVAAIYYEIRLVKEGVATDTIASVFD